MTLIPCARRASSRLTIDSASRRSIAKPAVRRLARGRPDGHAREDEHRLEEVQRFHGRELTRITPLVNLDSRSDVVLSTCSSAASGASHAPNRATACGSRRRARGRPRTRHAGRSRAAQPRNSASSRFSISNSGPRRTPPTPSPARKSAGSGAPRARLGTPPLQCRLRSPAQLPAAVHPHGALTHADARVARRQPRLRIGYRRARTSPLRRAQDERARRRRGKSRIGVARMQHHLVRASRPRTTSRRDRSSPPCASAISDVPADVNALERRHLFACSQDRAHGRKFLAVCSEPCSTRTTRSDTAAPPPV